MTPDDFLQDIIDNPDDDAPRLAFADWLEGHGELERAEFIRVQIKLATLPSGDGHRPALAQRAAELLARNEGAWAGPVRQRVLCWTFERGFIAEVGVTLDMYEEHTFVLLGLAPVRRLRVPGGEVTISAAARKLVPESIVREALVLPLGHARFGHDECLLVAVPAPFDVELLQKLNFILKRNLAPVPAPRQGLETAIARHYGNH